jgi:hypothetical protein
VLNLENVCGDSRFSEPDAAADGAHRRCCTSRHAQRDGRTDGRTF